MNISTVIKKAKRKRLLSSVILILVLSVLSMLFTGNDYLLLNLCTTGIYIIVVSGLDILVGYSGQMSLGHAGFFGIGAYGSALLNQYLGIPVFFSMIFGALLATLIAIPIGYFSARLRVVFLSLATTAFGTLIYLFLCNSKITGGFTGIFPAPLTILGLSFASLTLYLIFVLIFVVLFLLMKQNIVHSRTGRALFAIRENVHASNGMGIDVRKYKVIAFALSAFYAGFGGAMYAHLIQYLSPDTFVFNQSIIFLTVLVLGGRDTVIGPILGAVLLTAINTTLLPLGPYKALIYGIILLVALIFIPKGLVCFITELKLFKKVVPNHAKD